MKTFKELLNPVVVKAIIDRIRPNPFWRRFWEKVAKAKQQEDEECQPTLVVSTASTTGARS